MDVSLQEASAEVLREVDVAAEYASCGVRIVGKKPNKKGWVKCYAVAREDNHPSAEINVGSGKNRGRYVDWVTNENLSLFDFLAKYGGKSDWKDARSYLVEKYRLNDSGLWGVSIPGAPVVVREPSSLVVESAPEDKVDLDDQLAFQDWNASLADSWCKRKRGFDVDAVLGAGGRLAMWPKDSRIYPVVALPIFGPELTREPPQGWVIWHRGGRMLPAFYGKGEPPVMLKMKTVFGSKSGFMGASGLAAIAAAEVVWKCEGPTDMLAIEAAIPEELRGRHIAITNSGGCSEIPDHELLKYMAGKRVFVLHDADKPGQGIYEDGSDRCGGAKLWCREISKVTTDVRNVQLPYPIEVKHGHDARYFLISGGSYSDLLAIAESTPVFDSHAHPPTSEEIVPSPAPTPVQSPVIAPVLTAEVVLSDLSVTDASEHDRGVCRDIGIEVLGEVDGGGVKVFSLYHRKSEIIKDVTYLTYERLLQLAGPDVRAIVNRSAEPIPGMHTMGRIRESIAICAGFSRVSEDVEHGIGVWRGKRKEIVLVNGGYGVIVDDSGKYERFVTPRASGMIFDLSHSHEWFSSNTLRELLSHARANPAWRREVLEESVSLYSRWRWLDQDMSPTIVAGLAFSSWIQTLWAWRPQVAITGTSNSGKSTLFQVLGGGAGGQGMFGGLSTLSSQSSEAGIRQTIRNTASVLLLDEFEDSRERAKILELFRTTGRGAKILRGQTNQVARSYGLQHIPWVAAIEVGLRREPDRNRFVILDLVKPSENDFGKLEIPSDAWLHAHGQSMLAVALACANEAVALAVSLKTVKVPGVHQRIIESYSVPVAMVSAIRGMDFIAAAKMLEACTSNLSGEMSVADHNDLLEDIMTSVVNIGRGEQMPVSRILTSDTMYTLHSDALSAHGIAIVDSEVGKSLFVVHKVASKRLLARTIWENQSIQQILKRIPGAKVGNRRINGCRSRGIEIPFSVVADEFMEQREF